MTATTQKELNTLVLTREENQSIVIGNEITITVSQINERQVKLAIDAPRDIAVHREEIYDRISESIGE